MKDDSKSNQSIIAKLGTPPIATMAVPVILYTVLSFFVVRLSGAGGVIHIGSEAVPKQMLTGVFTNVANICLVLMPVLYRKIGYIASLVLLLMQFPNLIISMFVRHFAMSVPGLFSNLFTILAISIIYFNTMKIERYQNSIRELAVTDSLTGLPNRYACNELVDTLIRQGQRFAIVTIDINNFKSVNDSMGQHAGNEVLIELAARWRNISQTGTSGTSDFVTRRGGDEFLLVIQDYKTDAELLKTVECYDAALSKKVTVDECDFYITASFGYAAYPDDAESMDQLFSNADAAMQEVKRINSSDHILHYTKDMQKAERRMDIERKIRTALENDDLYFALQPQYDMSHKLRGFEALARMKDNDGTDVRPSEFIPIAENAGLIDKVDTAVFRKSAEFFGDLIRKTGADITLSVNVSVRHMMKNGFLDEISSVISECGIPADQLEVEITESIMIDSTDKALGCINELKKMGIKIAIDDFGTGYSSLSYLHQFPADMLKVDKSFIDKMNTGESSKQYVASIISIGHIMGFSVISEGVEQAEQLETLRDIGCDYIQGFIWGRPLPKEEAEKIVMEMSGR